MNIKLQKKHKTLLNKLWKNRNSKQRSFILVVILPTLLASIYYTFIASGLYMVESRFAVKGNEMQQMDLLSGLAGIPAQGGSSSDSYIVQDYISSIDIIQALSNDIDLEAIYNHPDADWFSAMGYEKTLEETLKYWRKRVTVSYDPTTTITTLKVRAFNPEQAQQLAKAIIRQSEFLVNSLSERARQDDLEFANEEVARAEARVTRARVAMNDFRTSIEDLDPTQTASAKMMLIAQLEGQLAQAKTELDVLLSYMNKSAPEVVRSTRRVNAIKNQIMAEKKRITSNGPTGDALAGVFADYEPLLTERTFSEKAYASTLASLEAARVEASRKHRYLATFVEPTLPDEAVEPIRAKAIATVFFGAIVAWAIGFLGIGIVREHVGWV